jgi:hypothetical protein
MKIEVVLNGTAKNLWADWGLVTLFPIGNISAMCSRILVPNLSMPA